jgi:hypothetical protein
MQGSDEVEVSDGYLTNAIVVEQPSDGSCLYHALSSCLKNSDIYLESYSSENGFLLRSSINSFMKKESHSYIFVTDSEVNDQ